MREKSLGQRMCGFFSCIGISSATKCIHAILACDKHKSFLSVVTYLKPNHTGYKMDLWKTWLHPFLMLNYHKTGLRTSTYLLGASITPLGSPGVSSLPICVIPAHCSHQWDWLRIPLFYQLFLSSFLLMPCATQLLVTPVHPDGAHWQPHTGGCSLWS